MAHIQVEFMKASALDEHVALARTSYDDPLAADAEHFWWKHGAVPAGPSACVALRDSEGNLVGRSMVQRRPFRVSPSMLRTGGAVFDLVIAPEHRSAMNFLALVRGQAKVEGLDLLVHTSNETSDPLYRKLMRYSVAFDLKAYALPLRVRNIFQKALGRTMPRAVEALAAPWRGGVRAAAFAARTATGLKIVEGLPDDAAFERLMSRFRAGAGPHFERSKPFLQWRFANAPVFSATLATVLVRDEPVGYVAWRSFALEGLTFFVIMDVVLAVRPSAAVRMAFWLEMARRGATAGSDAVFFMANPKNDILARLVGAPLIPVPDARLPHPTPIFVAPRSEDIGWLREHASTYLTLADIDYF